MEELNTSNISQTRDIMLSTVEAEFGFLLDIGYKLSGCVNDNCDSYVKYSSSQLNRTIIIVYTGYEQIEIVFNRNVEFLFSLKGDLSPKVFANISRSFENNPAYIGCHQVLNNQNYLEIIKMNAEFIKNHLLPVIKGQIWFNKLRV